MASMKLLLLVGLAFVASCTAAARSGSDSENMMTVKFQECYSKGIESLVFGPNPTGNSDRNFGKGIVYDSKVMMEDREVGRSRGLYIHDSMDGAGGQELFTVNFESGEFEGCSLTFGGHWSDMSDRNELAVTGGTGMFKWSTGSAMYKEGNKGCYEVRCSLMGMMDKHQRSAQF